ncbi:hypothetical protein HDV01_001343 [Terramyces sp. JEL0728]|nr:hypothetical protein HDV01_001343 [Terramyces sp. JEL0728]
MSTTQPYSVVFNPNPSFINTYQGQNLVLTPNYLNPVENHKRSTWDLVWTNWPDLYTNGLGDWEYYCPEATCKTSLNPDGWYSISDIPDQTVAWIAMGALRWSPKSNPVGNSETLFNITGKINGYVATQTIEMEILTASGSSNIAVTPYASAASCGTYGYSLSANGASRLGNPYGFGSFVQLSPIRPLCGSGSSSASTNFYIGDFTITPTDSNTVLLNGWISVDSTINAPTGFSVLNFTGTLSNIGVIDTGVYVNLANQITMITPEVRFSHASQIASKANVGALVYDTTSGHSWYLAAYDWNFDTNIPNRIKMIVSSSCLLVFGKLDNTINTILPAQFSALLYYVGLWSTKTYSFGSGGLSVSFQGSSDLSFMVSPISVLSAGTSPAVSYNVGFVQSISDTVITLSYPGNTTLYYWAQYVSSNSATGGSWVAITTTGANSSVNAAIGGSGIYGLFPAAQTASSSEKIANALFYLPLMMAAMGYNELESDPLREVEYDTANGFPPCPLSANVNEVDPFYLGSYDYYNNKDDIQHNLGLSLDTSFEGGQFRGLTYPKLRSEVHYGLGMFQPVLIPTPTDAYASAPAAFGVYQHSSHSTPHGEEYNSTVPLDITPENYDYYYQYQLENHNSEWLDQRNPYEMDQFSEFVQEDINVFDYPRINHSIHVNPAILEGNLGVESEQTIAIDSPHEKKRKGGRSGGQPTNIVPSTKMDRKTLKRLRNRVSASRCRIKKKEWIHEMEDQSLQLQDENMFLMERISFLEESIANSRKFLEYYQLQKAESSLNL